MIYDLTSQETSNYGRERGTVFQTRHPNDNADQSQKKMNEYIEFTTIATKDSTSLNDSYFKVKAHFSGNFTNNPTFTPAESTFDAAISKGEIYINGALAENIDNYNHVAKVIRCLMSSKEALSCGDNMFVLDDDEARYSTENVVGKNNNGLFVNDINTYRYLYSKPARKRRNTWFTCDANGNITGAAGKSVYFPYTPIFGLFTKASTNKKIFKGDQIRIKFYLADTATQTFVRGSTWTPTVANDGVLIANAIPRTENPPPADCRLVIDEMALALCRILPNETIELDLESIVRDEEKTRYYDYTTMVTTTASIGSTHTGQYVITSLYNGAARPKYVIVFFKNTNTSNGGSVINNPTCASYYDNVGMNGTVNVIVNNSRYPQENEEVKINEHKFTEMLQHIRDFAGGQNTDIYPVITHENYKDYPFLVFDISKSYDPSENLKNNEVTQISLEFQDITARGSQITVHAMMILDKMLEIKGSSTVVTR